jgi:hypothetical protein
VLRGSQPLVLEVQTELAIGSASLVMSDAKQGGAVTYGSMLQGLNNLIRLASKSALFRVTSVSP